jgi:hypothetical protein
MKNGWIGVDLDGTLAEYHGWQNELHIGPPIAVMVAMIKAWVAEGQEVRIFTARVNPDVISTLGTAESYAGRNVDAIVTAIKDWCLEHVGHALEVTYKKDYAMIALYDDRAFHVIPNTGAVVLPESNSCDRYLVICGGDGYCTVVTDGLDRAIAELGRMHIGSDQDMDDEMVEAIMKHARDPDNWAGGGASYKVDHEDGWAEIIKMSPQMNTFFDTPPSQEITK